jgi:hypothetical protein
MPGRRPAKLSAPVTAGPGRRPARGPACDIDDQILAMWRALRTNPSLDARWAMQVIDRLLDQRQRALLADEPG